MTDRGQIGLPARQSAIRLLAAVLHDKQPFDDSFHNDAQSGLLKSFTVRDRAFVHLIVATVLRRKGQIDNALSRFLQKPLPEKSGTAREVLLTAAAQLMFLKTPPHAAIDLALRAADLDRRARDYKSLINAVLRRVSENASDILESQDAELLNTPDWLWQRWANIYGDDTARAIARAHSREPSLDLTVKQDAAAWAERLGGHLMPTGSIRLLRPGRITKLDGYDEGAWWVQDAAATLPVRLLGDMTGKTALDLCAAPGGKTAQLAAAGAQVTAVDVSKNRMKRLGENLKRLNLAAEQVIAPVLEYVPDAPPDVILLDAPCSATGTIRRHPDVALAKTEDSIAELSRVQQRMLDHAIEILAPGGILVFCTCSLEPEESEHHAARVLAPDDCVRRVPVTADEIGGLSECITASGHLRTLPSHYKLDDPMLAGLDGFFAMRLQKL